jgi:RNA polymerase-interacting CarD/CdnL/TRCF family regulator
MNVLEEFNRYYVINFITNNLTSHIPIRKIEALGLRKTMSRKKVSQVFTLLKETPEDLPSFYKTRRKVLEDLLGSGRPLKVAEAVRDLTWRKQKNGLSPFDGQILSKGREILIDEIALVTDCDRLEASRRVDEALTEAIESRRAAE